MGGIFSVFFSRLPFIRFKSESFLVLDIGTFSVKALYAEKKGSGVKIKAYANEPYVTDVHTEEGLDVGSVINACRRALKLLKSASGRNRGFPKKAVLGIGGGFIYGKTLTQNYIRENPREEIDAGDFTNIIQKVQQRIYEQIRKDFSKDTARSELDVYLINASLQEVKIDGYQVVNPIGFKGKEVSVSLFNAYAPKSFVGIFEKLAEALKLDITSLVSEPQAVAGCICRDDSSKSDIILIDMGGSVTEIAVVRKGKLEDIKAIAVGGSSFTKSISGSLKIGLDEAENIKQRFAEGAVSAYASKKLEKIIARDAKIFLDSLRIVLGDLSQIALLPADIYIYGGGASMPVIKKMLRQKSWREKLSFFSYPRIVYLSPSAKKEDDFSISFPDALENTLWTVAVDLAKFYMRDAEKDDDIEKTISRSLRLIQG